MDQIARKIFGDEIVQEVGRFSKEGKTFTEIEVTIDLEKNNEITEEILSMN